MTELQSVILNHLKQYNDSWSQIWQIGAGVRSRGFHYFDSSDLIEDLQNLVKAGKIEQRTTMFGAEYIAREGLTN